MRKPVKIVALESCPSTMLSIKDVLQQSESHELVVVVAEQQTEGKGRYGRSWASFPGNIHCSIAFNQGGFSSGEVMMAASVLVRRVLGHYENVCLKWPNDLFVNGKKLAGILVEVYQDRFVLGVGVNIAYAPVPTSTSLAMVNGVIYDKWHIVRQIIAMFQEYTFKPFACAKEWNQHALLLNKHVCIAHQDNIIEGEFLGVNHTGAALLKKNNIVQKVLVGSLRCL